MPFPLAKLLALGLRQASRHVAAFVKNRAKTNERFKTGLVKAAGWYHYVQTKSRLSVLGMGRVKTVQPLSEQAAIDLGVEIINDLVLIFCGLTIYLLIESRPTKHKEKGDDDVKQDDIEKLKNVLLQQKLELERQAAKISRLERIIVLTSGTSKLSSTQTLDSLSHTDIDRKFIITKNEISIEDTIK